ncbi:MAG: endopeptidase La [Clostridia bacterium]|nr:endopeptidase La [Clostridia bacterium]MBP5593067.1 endopeptidase La [Clostridia bacterium]
MNEQVKDYLDRAEDVQSVQYILVPADKPVLPGQTVSLDVSDSKAYKAMLAAAETNGEIFIVLKTDGKDESERAICEDGFYRVGTLARIKQLIRLPQMKLRVVAIGRHTMFITNVTSKSPYYMVELESFDDIVENELELLAMKNILERSLSKLEAENIKISQELGKIANLKDFAQKASSVLFTSPEDIQKYLETNSLLTRLEIIDAEINKRIDLNKIEHDIESKLHANIEKNNKNYYLREKIRTISEELGDDVSDIEEYKKKLEAKKLPDYAREKAEKEISRMSKMQASSPEGAICRNYVDLILDLPWEEYSEEKLDLDAAEKILDEDHYGLDKVKKRILEYLAVRSLKPNSQAPILCFVGPPGVGKTSIVSSIARAANREFISMSLGGVRDEAEIRGHRRTYIGALPGRIISALKDTKVGNPVFLLDEIDKISMDYKGDPAAALLEVLDYKQNDHFKDNFLELPYDLSKVMFITTANTLDTVNPPLLDRMEVIQLSGYTDTEKLEIAKRYLVRKQCELAGLEGIKVSFSDEAILYIIHSYTRESGVRNLEREIGSVVRKIAVEIVRGGKKKNYKISEKSVPEYLGPEKYLESEADLSDKIGEVTGLAWTSVGGVTLNVEVAVLGGGKGEIKTTGQLGDVMKESALAALSLVRARASQLGIKEEMFSSYDIHLHVPEGATPKDGPSAGITMTTAIASALSGRAVRGDTAMTGEITLTGKVLAIGGLKEKALAALRNGKKRLIIPKENHKDISEIPEEVLKAVEIVEAATINDVFDAAFV